MIATLNKTTTSVGYVVWILFCSSDNCFWSFKDYQCCFLVYHTQVKTLKFFYHIMDSGLYWKHQCHFKCWFYYKNQFKNTTRTLKNIFNCRLMLFFKAEEVIGELSSKVMWSLPILAKRYVKGIVQSAKKASYKKILTKNFKSVINKSLIVLISQIYFKAVIKLFHATCNAKNKNHIQGKLDFFLPIKRIIPY